MEQQVQNNINNIPQPAQTAELASIPERLFAFIIDYMPFFTLSIGSMWVVGNTELFVTLSLKQMYIIMFSFQALFLVYVFVFSIGRLRTVGKWMMGIRLCSVDGGGLTVLQSFNRMLGYIIGFFTLFLSYAVSFVTPKKRALQDYMAGSFVIRERQKTQVEEFVISFVSAILIGLLVAFGYYSTFKSPSSYQNRLVYNAKDQLTKVAYLQELHKKKYGRYTLDLNRLALISGDAVQFKRDMQNNFTRNGFKMGVSKEEFRITGVAKDINKTVVTYP